MSSPKPITKAQQREKTLARLIAVGTEIFTREGYANASTEEIVQLAGVTRGALYHHFGSKEGLFQAVLALLQSEVAQRIEQTVAAYDNSWDQLIAGSIEFLSISLDPRFQRIMLIDAPAVVGWSLWREMDAQQSMKALREGLEALISEGVLPPLPLDALTHLLSGAMNEAALWIAQAEQPELALAEASLALKHLLEGLRR